MPVDAAALRSPCCDDPGTPPCPHLQAEAERRLCAPVHRVAVRQRRSLSEDPHRGPRLLLPVTHDRPTSGGRRHRLPPQPRSRFGAGAVLPWLAPRSRFGVPPSLLPLRSARPDQRRRSGAPASPRPTPRSRCGGRVLLLPLRAREGAGSSANLVAIQRSWNMNPRRQCGTMNAAGPPCRGPQSDRPQ